VRRVASLLLLVGLAPVLGVAALAWFERHEQIVEAAPRLTSDPQKVPHVDVALVPGTGPLTYWPDGHVAPNIPFVNRLDAAAALWRAGKIKYVIASGNRTGAYDEPTAIRDGLVERGVPAEIIYRDFAGYRTLDSLLRARDIYGVKRLVIVSQKSHDERALFLGRALGIDAWGLAVREEEPDGPSLLERLTVAGQALLAWWDVAVATPARERGQKVAIGVDPVN